MKKLIAITLAALLIFSFAACSNGSSDGNNTQTGTVKIADAKSIADLAGMKISAQQGTFHEKALTQIKDVKSSTYPEFSDLLTALKTGAIDGYVAEEPTAFAESLSDSSIAYVPLVNNDTGFTVTEDDVAVSIGLKKGSDLLDKINGVIAEITAEQKTALMNQIMDLCSGKTVDKFVLESEEPANPTGTLKVAMECAYRPYNWTETSSDTRTLGAVAISGEGKDGQYANGYDVQIAKYVANKLGLKLEIYSYEWESLIPAVNSGAVDAIVAGMSPTAERREEIDFTNPYYTSNLVVIYKK